MFCDLKPCISWIQHTHFGRLFYQWTLSIPYFVAYLEYCLLWVELYHDLGQALNTDRVGVMRSCRSTEMHCRHTEYALTSIQIVQNKTSRGVSDCAVQQTWQRIGYILKAHFPWRRISERFSELKIRSRNRVHRSFGLFISKTVLDILPRNTYRKIIKNQNSKSNLG